MDKDIMISIRISREERDLVRFTKHKYAEVWALGVKEIQKKLPEILEEIIGNNEKIVYTFQQRQNTEKQVFEKIAVDFTNNGMDIDDVLLIRKWVEGRLKKHGLKMSVDDFRIEYKNWMKCQEALKP